MNKNIIILNGAARKNGNTAKLVEAFSDGAKSAGNQVKTFYLDEMVIHGCKGCLRAGRDSKSPCSQKDDMEQIYAEFEERYLDIVNHCKVVPAVNQVETHVFRQQKKLRQLECQIGTKHESWSPLACGQNGIFKNQTLLEIAGNHSKSAAQIALRFLLQQGIIVIPKSTHIERMEENFAALNFDLEADEMREIEQLEIGKSLFGWW